MLNAINAACGNGVTGLKAAIFDGSWLRLGAQLLHEVNQRALGRSIRQGDEANRRTRISFTNEGRISVILANLQRLPSGAGLKESLNHQKCAAFLQAG